MMEGMKPACPRRRCLVPETVPGDARDRTGLRRGRLAVGGRMRAPGALAALPLIMLLLTSMVPAPAGEDKGGVDHADERPPNILFLSFDDLNFDLGCYGHPQVRSPHIDAIAARGVRFDRAFCQYPQCGQSRASMLAGLRPDHVRVYDLNTLVREHVPDVVTLPQWFRQHGYFVARSGKMFHQGVPGGIGAPGMDDPESWDHTHNPSGRDVDDEELLIDFTPQRGKGSSLNLLKAGGTDEEQTDGMVATEIIRLMEEQREGPWFLAAGFYRPHCPYVAPAKWFDLYPLDEVRLPEPPPDETWRASVPDLTTAFTRPWPWFGVSEHEARQVVQAYWATISFVDGQVGRIMEALQRLGLAEHTVVVVWSDHGYHLGEYGMFKKQSLLDRSAGAPLIIAAPGMAGNGAACARVVEFIDIYPTLAELAGLPLPEHLDGRSLKPLLAEPGREWDHPAVTQVHRNRARGYSIRTGQWRYTEWNRGEDGIELWNMRDDPRHLRNLAGDPDHAGVIEELRGALHAMPGVDAAGW